MAIYRSKGVLAHLGLLIFFQFLQTAPQALGFQTNQDRVVSLENSKDAEAKLLVARLLINFLPGGNVSLELVEEPNALPNSSAKLAFATHDQIAKSLQITETQQRKFARLEADFEKDISRLVAEKMETGKVDHLEINAQVGNLVANINTDIVKILSPDQQKGLQIIEGQRRMQILGWPKILAWMEKEDEFDLTDTQTKSIKEIIRDRRQEISLMSSRELDSIYEKVIQSIDLKLDRIAELNEIAKKNQSKIPFELLVSQLNLLDEEVVKSSVVEISRLQSQLDLNGEIQLKESQQLSFPVLIQTLCALQDGPGNDRFHFFMNEINDPATEPGKISVKYQKQFSMIQRSSGVSFSNLKKQFSEKMIEYDKEMLSQFRKFLFPEELENFDLAETKLEIIKIGVINSLCQGRLGDVLKIKADKKKSLREVVEAERKRLIEMGNKYYRETNNQILNLLSPKQRKLLNDKFLIDELETNQGLELVGTPELILMERH